MPGFRNKFKYAKLLAVTVMMLLLIRPGECQQAQCVTQCMADGGTANPGQCYQACGQPSGLAYDIASCLIAMQPAGSVSSSLAQVSPTACQKRLKH
eukprot:4674566-Pyramimonas_sp.AAC.1